MIRYGYTILYVENVEETLEFYTSAFGFTTKLLTPEKDYGEIETGATTLAFAAYSVAEYNGVPLTTTNPQSPAPGFEVTFVTDNVEAQFKKAIEMGAVAVAEPTQKPWGQIVAYVRDINGYLIELCTEVTG